MPRRPEPRFTRQAIPKIKRGGLVVPSSARPSSAAPEFMVTDIRSNPPPTAPPNSFTLWDIDYPFDRKIFMDGATIDTGVYEFSVKDSLIGVYDMLTFQDDEFGWSLATTDQTVILAALNIGETFDVKLKRPYEKILHVMKYHFPPTGVPNSGYGEFPIHLLVEKQFGDWLRITTSYEPGAEKTGSRLPFFFGFKVFGFRRSDRRPVWRRFIADATTYALTEDWGAALIHVAFALESFLDMQLIRKYKKAAFPESYQDHLLRVGEKRHEFHALLHGLLPKKEINKLYETANKAVFTVRNDIAHGRRNRDAVTPEQFILAIKMAVELIWDLDINSRRHLVPVVHELPPSSLIDKQLLKNCGMK